MSKTLDQIKTDSLTARKARESDKAAFLVTLASDISMLAKNDGNREPTDEDALTICKRFEKGLREVLSVRPGDEQATREMALLAQYMPAKLGEAELKSLIDSIAAELGLAKIGPKEVGLVMKNLNARAAGQFDGASASKIIKSMSA